MGDRRPRRVFVREGGVLLHVQLTELAAGAVLLFFCFQITSNQSVSRSSESIDIPSPRPTCSSSEKLMME